MTTYLSLAGRFSVLMPNNGKGGGISRKITNVKDRKALRTIIDKFSIQTQHQIKKTRSFTCVIM